MSCNGYHKLQWYYTYPQHAYQWTNIRGREPRYVLVEYQPLRTRIRCPCQRTMCQCPNCPFRSASQSSIITESSVLNIPSPVQSRQSVLKEDCGCSL
jgi:hypothetical protein